MERMRVNELTLNVRRVPLTAVVEWLFRDGDGGGRTSAESNLGDKDKVSAVAASS
jgi:hypothetical protein